MICASEHETPPRAPHTVNYEAAQAAVPGGSNDNNKERKLEEDYDKMETDFRNV